MMLDSAIWGPRGRITSTVAVACWLAIGIGGDAGAAGPGPTDRGYEGPTAPTAPAAPAAPAAPTVEAPPPGDVSGPPTPAPIDPPPAEQPSPPAGSPPPVAPAPTPPPAKPEPAPAQDDSFDGGFEVVDLTEDEEALEKELAVETVRVKGAKGKLSGTVKDAMNGGPMIGAYVEAVGTDYKTKTDLDGNYELELPPGTYDIRIRDDSSQPRRRSGIVVTKDSTETFNAELKPLAGANQVVAIEAEMNRESEGARLMQRKESVGTRDLMSRDEFAKSGGGSTSAVARRIVGSTVVGGRFLFIRGLGHRYGNTLFDGARVPSPEPELRTVPLDIFPSGALSAINIQKTFTPDVPGDFAGGSTQLESRDVPDELIFEVNAEIGANTATTGRDIVHNGSFAGADAFGFGNLPRGLPGAIPSNQPASRLLLGDNFNRVYSDEDIERFGEALYTDTRVRRGRLGPPNFGAKATLGYGFKPKDGGKFGFLLAAGYKNKHQTLRETQRQFGLSNGELDTATPQVNYESTKTTMNVAWSSVGLLKWDVDKNHRLSLIGFYSRDADDETREFRGTALNVSGPAPAINTRLRYVMRSVMLTRLGGRHKFPKAKDLTLDWFGSFAQARRDDPSMRDMFFTDANGDGTFDFDVGNDAGKQLFLGLVDNTESGSVNFTLPFKQWIQLKSKFKVGMWVEGKQRDFNVRRFSFNAVQDLTAAVPSGTGNIINNGTIGGGTSAAQGGTAPFFLQETTRPNDNYRANQQIYAGYALLELPLVRWFKIAGGARFEANRMEVDPFDPFADPDAPAMPGALEGAKLSDNDVLPSASLIFSPTEKQNIRIVGTRTLARPEFRELAPFVFTDFVGGADVAGNPDLVSTKIWNADLRWEWFPSANEVVAASVFYKYFDEPIERVIVPRIPQQINYTNADAAHNVGAELEARKNLEFIWKKLTDLSVGVNVAYVFSRVRLRDPCDPLDPACNVFDVSTSRSRPLQGQSPFVVNAYISYDNERSGTNTRLLFNTFGRRISEVGGLGLPDIYEESRHRLDFVLSQRLYKGLSMNLGATNILNWPERFTQGSDRTSTYRALHGATFTVGLGYKL